MTNKVNMNNSSSSGSQSPLSGSSGSEAGKDSPRNSTRPMVIERTEFPKNFYGSAAGTPVSSTSSTNSPASLYSASPAGSPRLTEMRRRNSGLSMSCSGSNSFDDDDRSSGSVEGSGSARNKAYLKRNDRRTPHTPINTGDTRGTTTTTSTRSALATTSPPPIYTRQNLSAAFNVKEFGLVRTLIGQLIQTKRSDINQLDANGYAPLHHAAFHGCFDVAQALLDAGAARNAITSDGYTAIMLAAFAQQRAMVEFLGSDRIGTNSTIVHTTNERAVERPSASMSWEQMNTSLGRMRPQEYQDAFMNAVKQSDVVMAARMLARGNINLSKQDRSRDTPMVLASRVGSDEMIKLLLCNGAKLNDTDHQGASPILHAVKGGNLSIIQVSMQAGADPTQADKWSNSALSVASDNDDAEALGALLDGMNGSGKLHELGPKILYEAASKGKINNVQMLLRRNIGTTDRNGNCALIRMVKNKNLNAVNTLLKAGDYAHEKDFDGHTAFTLAAANGHEDIVNALFDHCPASCSENEWLAKLQNETDSSGRTALMLAVLNRHRDMTNLLIDKKADIHKKDLQGRNAMLWAAGQGGDHLVSALCSNGATHLVCDNEGNNVFLAAAANNDKDVLSTFCGTIYANGPIDINSPNIHGDTPLIVAARLGHFEIVELLLKKNANYIHRNRKGQSAFLEALSNKHWETCRSLYEKLTEREKNLAQVNPLVRAMIKTIIDIASAARDVLPALPALKDNQTDHEGNSELHILAKGGHHEALKYLLARRSEPGCNVGESTATLSDNEFALDEAKSGFTFLQANDLNIEITNNEGLTPLCEAVRYGRYEAVKVLLVGGANVNHASGTGDTPLWLACRPKVGEAQPGKPISTGNFARPLIDLVELLLENEATPDAPSFDRQSPLMAASAIGDSSVVQCLLKAGANISRANDHGFTPLMFASYFGHVEVATTLLDNLAMPNPDPGNKLSALLLAAENGHDDIVRLLIERGAKPNYQHEDKSTALTVASAAGKVSTVKRLVLSGADRSIQDKFGKNAMDYATANGHHAVVQVLKEVYRTPRNN